MKDRVRLVPLGGLGEIGMNCMSIECGDHRLLVDCGVTFPDHPFGTDVVRPDFRYLSEEPKRHTAVWITHGHEDHIGAVPYLLREHAVPVYGPPYALTLIRERLAEQPPRHTPELITVAPGERHAFGPFEAEPVRVTHSIADATSLALSTPVGVIVHTGDFKIDPTPPDHERFDEARFRALGDAGVRLLLSDSTNVDTEGSAGSEMPVAALLEELVQEATGRVLITLFASNTHRLRAAIDIARRSRRKLCWLGRSVQTHSKVAHQTGYLERADEILITPAQALELPRQRVLFAATGSQAEPASALARIARRVHPHVALDPGDTVILSSRIIPGNDRPVSEVIDRLLRQGIRVIDRRSHRGVHVSGHAHREEQRKMLELTRPEFFMPVHGTYHHLTRHAELARDVGVRDATVAQNGDVVELDERSLKLVDRVSSGRVHMTRGIDVPHEVVAERSRLAELGTIAISFVVDARGQLLAAPDITARGVLLGPDSRDLLGQARVYAKRAFRQAVDDDLLVDVEALREHVRRRMTRFFLESIGQRAVCMVLVHVLRS